MSGNCISADREVWKCRCHEGYKGNHCQTQTCDNYTQCNHGIYILIFQDIVKVL